MEVQALPESTLIQEISRPLYETRNWLKLIGITQIVFSAIVVLGLLALLVIGFSTMSGYLSGYSGYTLAPLLLSLIPIGLSIWQSVLLIQAGNSAQTAGLHGDKAAMIRALSNLKTYFIIIGVLLIIGIILALLSICASIFLSIAGASLLSGSGLGLP